MKRRLLSLLLSLCLVFALFPGALAQEEAAPSLTALCVARPGQSVSLDVEEFRILCRQATGHELERVSFPSPYSRAGTLSCKGERVTPDITYYLSSFSPQLSQISFTPTPRFTGQAEVSFLLTSEKEETVPGTLLLYVPQDYDLTLSLPQSSALDLEAMDRLCRQETGAALSQLSFPSVQGSSLLYGEERTLITPRQVFYVQPSSEKELPLAGISFSSFHAAYAVLTVKGRSVEDKGFSAKVRVDLPEKDSSRWAQAVNAGKPFYVGRQFSPFQYSSLRFFLPSSDQGALWLNYGSSDGRKLLPEETLYADRDPSFLQLDFVPAKGADKALVHLGYTFSEDSFMDGEGVLSLQLKSDGDNKAVSTSLPVPLMVSQVNLSSALSGACEYRHLGQAETICFLTLPTPEEGVIQSNGSPVVLEKSYPYHSLGFVPGKAFRGKLTLRYTGVDSLDFSYSGTLTLSQGYPHGGARFQDLDQWDWASFAVEFLDRQGAVLPADIPLFRPGEAATRIELIYSLVQVAYSGEEDLPLPSFPDLPADEDLARAAAVAAAHGLVLGDEENRLLPDAQVTRQDALTLLYRTLTELGQALPAPADLSAFSDAGELAPYARQAAEVLCAKGILRGDGSGRLNPLSPITRAEMACLLYRAFGGQG